MVSRCVGIIPRLDVLALLTYSQPVRASRNQLFYHALFALLLFNLEIVSSFAFANVTVTTTIFAQLDYCI